VREVLLLRSGGGETYDRVRGEAEARGVSVRFADRFEFDRLFGEARHQGVAAGFAPGKGVELRDAIAAALANHRPLVALDGIEDPQNVGAIIRSAEVLGSAGIILPERRSAGLTAGSIKASAGAALRFPVVNAGNLAQALREIKRADIWVVGLDMAGEESLFSYDFPLNVCLVMGSEGSGLARLTRDLCDGLVRIPQEGEVGSLNVSAAAAAALSELLRRRLAGNPEGEIKATMAKRGV